MQLLAELGNTGTQSLLATSIELTETSPTLNHTLREVYEDGTVADSLAAPEEVAQGSRTGPGLYAVARCAG